PPPPGLNYVAVIEPELSLLLLDIVLSSILVPILVIMLYLSTPATRWKPVFVMNVISIILALAYAAVTVYQQSRAILAKTVNPNADTASACMLILAPFFAELILVIRVVAVYPPFFMSWFRRILVYAPIALLKTARIVNIVAFLVQWVRLNKHTYNPLQTGQDAWNLPNVKIEWILQFLDMSFVSVLFLARLHQSTRLKRNAGLSDSCLGTPSGNLREYFSHTAGMSFSSRIRTLFWIAATNLVIPVLLIFVQLVYIFRDNSFLHGTYVFIANIHVQIIGVLLATIWSTGSQ
ncbi:hypothetical protein GY45DRAFT_1216088, partial [Cubamyces sp. BRFM 1775]